MSTDAPKKCNVPGCGAAAELRGVCKAHYKQWWALKFTDKKAHKKLLETGVILPPYHKGRQLSRLAESLPAVSGG